MIFALWLVGALLFISFLLIVVRGAPFVPTRTRDLEKLFTLYTFKPHELLVDLGSGDGRVLEAAAKRGIHSVGYELNPFLAWYSMLRLTRYRAYAQVRLADFWLTPLPENTAVVFVFLATPFMSKLDQRLEREALRLGHDILLISYGMKIAHRTPEATHGGFLVYRYSA
jgi:hypothetical protein